MPLEGASKMRRRSQMMSTRNRPTSQDLNQTISFKMNNSDNYVKLQQQQQQEQQNERLCCAQDQTTSEKVTPMATTSFEPKCSSESIRNKMNASSRFLNIQRTRISQLMNTRNWLRGNSSALLCLTLGLCLVLNLSPISLNAEQQSNTNKQQQADVNKQTFQLMRSADVELKRSTLLARQQRDATATLTSNQEASTGTTMAVGAPAATCGYPGSPPHASVTFNTSHVLAGTAASYTCDNGYELLGPPRRICQANGTWSPVGIPFCVLNVGLGKAAMQSSTAGHGSAQKAVDGSTSAFFQANTCTMTDVEHNPWWYVNLLEPYLVQIVRIDFGQACCANRQKATIAVRVGNNRPDLGTNPLCNRYHGYIEDGKPLFLPCTRPVPGAFVSIHLEAPSGSSLSICETFIYTDHALSIEQCPSYRDQQLGSTATYNGKCYMFHNNQALNFDGARKYCESRGGTLVDETSPALQGFLSWELYRRHRNDQLMGQYWLGAVRDTRNSANWKWINGRDVQISFWNSLTNQGNCSRFDGSKGWLWSDTECQAQLNFICQHRPLSCGKPEKPTNSTLITKNIDNGTVIEYQCAPGNLLMGPKSRTCLGTGFFSDFAPKCKYLDCQFPALIANGDYKLLNGTTSYQSVVTYFCNDGYHLYGRSTLTCDVDERWNGPPPRCEPLLCPAPVEPSNGYVTVTSNITTPGTQATYDCRPNYELVGDRLLTCLSSGSWDNSFPYCREKRQIMVASTVKPVVMQPNSRQSPAVGATSPKQPIQFPTGNNNNNNALFNSNRVAPSVSSQQAQQPPQTIGSSGSSTSAPLASSTVASQQPTPPASLNGLAGQTVFVAPSSSSGAQASNQAAPSISSNEIQSSPQPPTELQQQNRKPAQSSSMSSFAQPPPSPQQGDANADHRTPIVRPQSPVLRGPQMINLNQTPTIRQQPQPQPHVPISSSTTQSSNKFTFAPIQQPGNQLSTGYDSSPLATTNSISVHSSSSSPSSSSPHPHLHSSTTSGPPSSSSSSSSPSIFSSTPSVSTTSGGSLLPSPSTGGNVLASFAGGAGASIRGQPSGHHQHHSSLANAKYSLDGIIAVAIFGGFIFLGAIITILVIIIRRRKSGRSSAIDAQTISTYDSNVGEHNGLYRNYQQAWENLRFAAPGSQPKSSGNGPPPPNCGGGMMAVAGSQIMGLKNYASSGVSALHHAHPAATTGHHNLGMSSSSTTSSSSQSSSSLAVTGPAGSGGADPLLGPHHHSSHQLHTRAGHSHHGQTEMLAHHHHAYHTGDLASDDDDDDERVMREEEDEDDEQGVISADEANYHPQAVHRMHVLAAPTSSNGRHQHHAHLHHQHHMNEGFRDSNELTINADTATLASSSAVATGGAQAMRRRLYSTNSSVSRSMAAAAGAVNNNQRRSISNLVADQTGQVGGGRLVSTSSTSTNSTRSSRNSPQGDDHSLERLAYGNNWHNHRPNGS